MVQEGKEHVRGRWDFPGGKMENGESVRKCAAREFEEETGYQVEITGFYGSIIEEAESRDLPVIVFLLEARITGEGKQDHDFEGEILDKEFYSFDEDDLIW